MTHFKNVHIDVTQNNTSVLDENGIPISGDENVPALQSRESFEDNALQAKELQIKRQYIDELRYLNNYH